MHVPNTTPSVADVYAAQLHGPQLGEGQGLKVQLI